MHSPPFPLYLLLLLLLSTLLSNTPSASVLPSACRITVPCVLVYIILDSKLEDKRLWNE
jgi:Gpi18-like mannosyltransferase